MREPVVELIQAGDVVHEELRLERGERSQQNEDDDEQITDDPGEVAPEVPLKDGKYDVTSHLTGNLEEISDTTN